MSDFEKPSRPEDEYFARQEIEKRKQWAKDRADKMASSQREELKELHFMKCPKCGMDLSTIEIQGVNVDQCGNCGGLWLDAGELQQMLGGKGVFDRVLSAFR